MGRGKARRPDPWHVAVTPAGTALEAAAVAERVQAMVAGWIRRDLPEPRGGEPSGESIGGQSTGADSIGADSMGGKV